jgi:hypothetical protein
MGLFQLLAISFQLSAFSYQLSAISHQLCAVNLRAARREYNGWPSLP